MQICPLTPHPAPQRFTSGLKCWPIRVDIHGTALLPFQIHLFSPSSSPFPLFPQSTDLSQHNLCVPYPSHSVWGSQPPPFLPFPSSSQFSTSLPHAWFWESQSHPIRFGHPPSPFTQLGAPNSFTCSLPRPWLCSPHGWADSQHHQCHQYGTQLPYTPHPSARQVLTPQSSWVALWGGCDK